MSDILFIFVYMDNTEYDELYLRFMLGTYNPSAEVVDWLVGNFEERELYERCIRLKKYRDRLPTEEWELEITFND